jgi:hypothetical protein
VAAILEVLDQVELPERPLEVERRRHDPAHQLTKLGHRSGDRQGRVAHVPAQVEAVVVGPHRVAELHRRLGDPLAKAGDESQPRLDMLQELVQRRRLALQDQRCADVDVDRPTLGEQGRHVGGGETLGGSIVDRVNVPS